MLSKQTRKDLENFLLSNEEDIAIGVGEFDKLFSVFNEILSRDPRINE